MSDMSTPTPVTPSDQKPRAWRSTQYTNPRYYDLLMTKGFYTEEPEQGMTDESERVCRELLDGFQDTPKETLFDDAVFQKTCQKLIGQNEERVLRDIAKLIVPSVEGLASRDGNGHLTILKESVNAGWNNSMPLTEPRPQPDFSVGFGYKAFTADQLSKLAPFIGEYFNGETSLFMATSYMHFPFFACEVKCGGMGLDIADRQNAHSMTMAVRAIVELFRIIGRVEEVNRQVLAFSISHDNNTVRIYGHYAVIDGDIKYYRKDLRSYQLSDMDGRDRWTAYRFTKNVYDNWMPGHFKRICSAIEQLPSEVDFDVQTPS